MAQRLRGWLYRQEPRECMHGHTGCDAGVVSYGQLGNFQFPVQVYRDIARKLQNALICIHPRQLRCFANGDKMVFLLVCIFVQSVHHCASTTRVNLIIYTLDVSWIFQIVEQRFGCKDANSFLAARQELTRCLLWY